MGIEVVVVEVAQRSLVANEEAGRTVAEAFVDFREGESDRADMEEMAIAHNYQSRASRHNGPARTRVTTSLNDCAQFDHSGFYGVGIPQAHQPDPRSIGSLQPIPYISRPWGDLTEFQ